jgi:DNA-binding FadR family transcriptional regulator
LIRGDHSGAERWLPAERSLAEQLGVSRTVVREATKRPEQQGLLEVQHGTGIRVVDKLHRPLNGSLELLIPDIAERLQQLNETRLSIEPYSAGLAAQRATKEQIRALRRIHADLETAPDNTAAIVADLNLHRALAEASGNLIFRLILDSLAEVGLASRQRTIGRIGKSTAIEHHARVLDAIEARDPGAARQAMHRHILDAGEDMDLPSLKARKSE